MNRLLRVRASLVVAGFVLTGAFSACTEDAGDPVSVFPNPGVTGDSGVGATAGGGTAGAGGLIGATPDGGSGPGVNPLGGTMLDAGAAPGGGKDGGTTTGANGLPCAVKKIVDMKCNTCHSDPPQGTWMSLTTQAHFQAAAQSDKTKKYYQVAKTRINDTKQPMPPAAAPNGALTADEKATLNAWLDQGAPASTETCGAIIAPDAGTGPVDTTGLECTKFLAHAKGDKTAKFKVGSAKDKYYNFGFKAPWNAMVYGVLVRPVIDNSKVLHHWLLYREQINDGDIKETIGQHTGGELIHGWAPGGIELNFRKHGPDVGFELPAGSYAVEFHYNSTDANAEDASGVEVCYQKNAPKNIASMSWLGWDQGGAGSFALGGTCLTPATTWTGTCKPANQKEPIHMLFMIPHLHQTGRHVTSTIKGVDGKTRTLHDKPFDFAYQTTYETTEVLMPGETITTTCTFSEPKCAGNATAQEMCYLFTYAYPKKALIDNGAEGKFIHGEGTCLGM